jgi:hypothetical protein
MGQNASVNEVKNKHDLLFSRHDRFRIDSSLLYCEAHSKLEYGKQHLPRKSKCEEVKIKHDLFSRNDRFVSFAKLILKLADGKHHFNDLEY